MSLKFQLHYGIDTPTATIGGTIRAVTVEDLQAFLRAKSKSGEILFARIEDMNGVIIWVWRDGKWKRGGE